MCATGAWDRACLLCNGPWACSVCAFGTSLSCQWTNARADAGADGHAAVALWTQMRLPLACPWSVDSGLALLKVPALGFLQSCTTDRHVLEELRQSRRWRPQDGPPQPGRKMAPRLPVVLVKGCLLLAEALVHGGPEAKVQRHAVWRVLWVWQTRDVRRAVRGVAKTALVARGVIVFDEEKPALGRGAPS